MPVGVWRWLTFSCVLVPAVAVGALAQPPLVPYPPDKPAFDRKVGTDDAAAERARLQADLLLLLKRISVSPTPPSYPPSGPSFPKPKIDSGTGSKSVDAIREGMNYFRDNDFEAARRTFQLIDPTVLGREDRAFVRYMLACSLRRQNRPSEAEAIYREVANSQDDEFYANCAIWQLSLIKSEQDLRVQLEQLRSRAKSK